MRTAMSNASHNRGFSLVELMVAVVLAIITGLAVLLVLSSYESRKRTVTVGNDAEINAAVGAYMVEREVRMAGAGLTGASGMLCGNGMNVYYNATVSDGAPMAPVLITDGGTGPDSIRVMRSSAAFGVAPGLVIKTMPGTTGLVTINDDLGLANGNLFVVGASDGTKLCTLMQMTKAALANGSGWDLTHAANTYNPANPSASFTSAPIYGVGDIVTNLGAQALRAFRVICNDDAAPSLTNACFLVGYNPLQFPNPTWANIGAVDSIASQVVDFQLQYGVAPAGSQTVDTWTNATGGTWAAGAGTPTAANQQRIKAVRMAIVTRGNQEKDCTVAPATYTLFAGLTGAQTVTLSAAQRCYRYKVLTVVVPLINIIWAAT
jgi:type IV pilus assembly protein PilW